MLSGVTIPITQPGDLAGDTAASDGLSRDNLLNFLLSGAMLLAVFYSAQEELRKARGER